MIVRSLMSNIFNMQLTISNLVNKRLKLLNNYIEIDKILSNNDERFYKKIGFKSFSELAQFVFENGGNKSDREKIIAKVNDALEHIFNRAHSNLPRDKVLYLAEGLIEVTERIGRALYKN